MPSLETGTVSPCPEAGVLKVEIKIFGKKNCARCQTTKNKFHFFLQKWNISAQVPINFYDLDTVDGLAEGAFLSVREVPTTILDSGGEEKARWTGEVPKSKDFKKYLLGGSGTLPRFAPVPEIKGFIANSLIEWDGRIAYVIFVPHCNFRCPWCHVPDLAFHPESLDTVPLVAVEETIRRQKGWLDGVVISGGEPTVHPSLPEFIGEIRGWGTPVKLETNGSYPDMLRELMEDELIDFVAMDIKNTVESDKYERTVGTKVDVGKIRESIDFIMKSKLDYEFRTTVVPAFVYEEDIEEIAGSIKGAKKYILQQFVPENAYEKKMTELKPYSPEKLKEMARRAGGYVKNCQVRGI